MREQKEKIPSVRKEVPIKTVFSPDIRRFYFNRFNVSRIGGLQIVNVWYQDDLLRISNSYAFIIDDEDLVACVGSTQNYLMRVMRDSPVSNEESCVSERAIETAHVDPVRFFTSSRYGNRAEIYLGFIPLVKIINPDASDDLKMNMDIALCSRLDCHVELLRKIVEKQ